MRKATVPIVRDDAAQAVELKHLSHDPFAYVFRLENTADKAADITLRVFLAPEALIKSRRHWIEMDKFTARLGPKERKAILRLDNQSEVIKKPVDLGPDSYIPADETDDTRCACGWPYARWATRSTAPGRVRSRIQWRPSRTSPGAGSPSGTGGRGCSGSLHASAARSRSRSLRLCCADAGSLGDKAEPRPHRVCLGALLALLDHKLSGEVDRRPDCEPKQRRGLDRVRDEEAPDRGGDLAVGHALVEDVEGTQEPDRHAPQEARGPGLLRQVRKRQREPAPRVIHHVVPPALQLPHWSAAILSASLPRVLFAAGAQADADLSCTEG
jgi:hypothetical protein